MNDVINLIRTRYLENSKPKRRNDNFKLGLVIEGGSMRGIVSTGMASALHILGLKDTFDAVYGASAGALTGSFFITDMIPLGPGIYYEELTSKRFINLFRAITNDYVMNLDHLIKYVLQGTKPLNWRGVMESDIPLNIVVSSVNERKEKVYNRFKSKEDVFTLLKASANIPFIAGPPIPFEDDLFLDASIYESIPVNSAQTDGCTHVLVLMSKPFGQLRDKLSFFEKVFILPKLRKLKGGMDDDYSAQIEKYNNLITILIQNNLTCNSGFSTYSICPDSNDKIVKRLEKNPLKLREGAISGMKAVFKTFCDHSDQISFFDTIYPIIDGAIPKPT